jgi:hypothetical protein
LLETLHLSHVDQIVIGGESVPPAILGDEPPHDWCYYYEKADLARQAQDWQAVVDLGQAAEAECLTPAAGFGGEYLPFIEGYAHAGDWDRAQRLSETAAQDAGSGLCRLWTRVEQSGQLTTVDVDRIRTLKNELGCSS